jgi:hypothetical protein
MSARQNSDVASNNTVPLALSEFPALPVPERGSSDDNESLSLDAELLRALKESLRFAQERDDPALARAVEESKEALLEQQRALLKAFEDKAKAREEEERRSVQAALVAERAPKGRRRRRTPIPLDEKEVLGFFHAGPEGGNVGNSRQPERRHSRMATNSQARPRHIQRWERPPAPNIDPTKVWSGAPPSLGVQQVVEPELATTVAQGRTGSSVRTDSRARLLRGNENIHVIIDGEDVGSLYGGGEWKARGVELAVRHFLENGQECLAIVPAHREAASEQSCKMVLRRIRQCFRNVTWIQPPCETYRLDVLEHAVCVASEARVILISNHDFSEEMSDMKDPITASAFRSFLSRSRVSFVWLGDVLSLQHDVEDVVRQGL